MIVAFIAWFAILFTGEYPPGLWNLAAFYLRWRVRALAYTSLLRDEYPPFGDGEYPASVVLQMPSRAAGSRQRCISSHSRDSAASRHLGARRCVGDHDCDRVVFNSANGPLSHAALRVRRRRAALERSGRSVFAAPSRSVSAVLVDLSTVHGAPIPAEDHGVREPGVQAVLRGSGIGLGAREGRQALGPARDDRLTPPLDRSPYAP